MKIEYAFYINCKPSNNASFLIASKYGHICIIRLEPYVLHGTSQSMDSFMCLIPENEVNRSAYHLFISIYCRRSDQLAFSFSVNLDLGFFWSILLAISTEHFGTWYVWFCVLWFPKQVVFKSQWIFHLLASFLNPCRQDQKFLSTLRQHKQKLKYLVREN